LFACALETDIDEDPIRVGHKADIVASLGPLADRAGDPAFPQVGDEGVFGFKVHSQFRFSRSVIRTQCLFKKKISISCKKIIDNKYNMR
jgi:hypothetical protein